MQVALAITFRASRKEPLAEVRQRLTSLEPCTTWSPNAARDLPTSSI
jgi:hypothetical protein